MYSKETFLVVDNILFHVDIADIDSNALISSKQLRC